MCTLNQINMMLFFHNKHKYTIYILIDTFSINKNYFVFLFKCFYLVITSNLLVSSNWSSLVVLALIKLRLCIVRFQNQELKYIIDTLTKKSMSSVYILVGKSLHKFVL